MTKAATLRATPAVADVSHDARAIRQGAVACTLAADRTTTVVAFGRLTAAFDGCAFTMFAAVVRRLTISVSDRDIAN